MTELSEIKSILKEQNIKLNDIHFAIFGNSNAKVKGMAETMNEHSKVISEYKKFKWLVIGATMGGWAGFIAWLKSQLPI